MSASAQDRAAQEKQEQKLPRHERKVRDARREVEARVEDLRTAMGREFKWLPLGRAWTLPLVGVACGLVMAFGRTRNREKAGMSGRKTDDTD